MTVDDRLETSTVEDYLKSIFLEEQRRPGAPVSTGLLSARLGVAPGTATAMARTLAERGLAIHKLYNGLRLTASGRRLAVDVVRRHRLLELFLVDVVGMDWSEVHAEADHLEHVVSDRLVACIDELLGQPVLDPHGDPIPTARGRLNERRLPTLIDCRVSEELCVVRVRDQHRDFLRLLDQRGVVPGRGLRVMERIKATEIVRLEFEDGSETRLGFRAAVKIEVEPAPESSCRGRARTEVARHAPTSV